MQRGRRFLQASCKVCMAAGYRSSTNPLGGGAMKGRLQVSAAAVVAAAAFTVAACGGSDDGGGGATKAAADATSKLSSDPMTLTFLWFDWAPAKALPQMGQAD